MKKSQVPKPSKPDLSEHAEQSLLISWWLHWAPAHGIEINSLFAIPNAAKRSFSLAAWLKAEGLRAGVPDLFLAKPAMVPGSRLLALHGLFIEMKSRHGKVTPGQADYRELLECSGYQVSVCHGCEQAIAVIEAYLGLSEQPEDGPKPAQDAPGRTQTPRS